MKDGILKSKTSPFSTLLVLKLIAIVVFAVIPLLVDLPYRINIFLAWEGAYRLYLGQIPFKDFGLPLGYGFWLIPALFFKIFGPYFFTLIKAQVFINILNGIVFSSLLKILGVKPSHKFIAVLLFVISYSFINFWPWYNHTVFFYQLLSMYFLVLVLFRYNKGFRYYAFILLSALFLFLSLFTKQDGGAFAFCITFFILVYHSIIQKNIKVSLTYWVAVGLVAAIIIVPLIKYDFGYWFNYGQPPHTSRLFLADILHDIFRGSHWIKFYILVIVILVMLRYKTLLDFVKDKQKFTFFLITLGILVQAMLVQVTSYIPHNVNIYFHSFAIAFIISNLDVEGILEKKLNLTLIIILLTFWWSADFWVYGQRILNKIAPGIMHADRDGVVSKHTWMVQEDTVKVSRHDWVAIEGMPAFKNILMPPSTAEGIKRLSNIPNINYEEAKVLNMSELTPLSYELGFTPETGTDIPLWYHKDVALFEREIEMYIDKIERNYYDLVLFESIDYLNGFYPQEIKDALDSHESYELIDTFLAPRQIQNSHIYVYMKK